MAFTIIALSLLKALDWLFTPLPMATTYPASAAALHMRRILERLITLMRISPTRMRRTGPPFPSLHRLVHLELDNREIF